MGDWVVALLSVGAGTGVALVLREVLIYRIAFWSMNLPENDHARRRHALALLRILKPAWRRDTEPPADPPIEPHKNELPPGPKDPPAQKPPEVTGPTP